MHVMMDIEIRHARRAERDWLLALQEISLHEFGCAHYDERDIGSFIREIGTMDERMIADRTLFVAVSGQTIVGCGGWSVRATHEPAHVQPGALVLRPTPRIRSIYVHPAFARRGVARQLLAAVENDIAAAGHDCAHLSATLNSTEFFRASGYHGRKTIPLRLAHRRRFPVVAMSKWLMGIHVAAA